jgi:hypothetical protein
VNERECSFPQQIQGGLTLPRAVGRFVYPCESFSSRPPMTSTILATSLQTSLALSHEKLEYSRHEYSSCILITWNNYLYPLIEENTSLFSALY